MKRSLDTKKSNEKFAIIIGLSGLFAPAYAQWLHADPGTPRTRDGKPILTAPAPRLNGHPDLSGVWEAARPTLDSRRSYNGESASDPLNLQITIPAIERMRDWKGGCRNRLREELQHQLVSVRTGGGGTVEACTKLR